MPSLIDSTQSMPFGLGRRAAGLGVALLVGALIVLIFTSIQNAATATTPRLGEDIGHLVRMTAIQAGLSTILSLITGIAAAWALDRLRFPGRGFIVSLFAAAIVTPGLIVALGLIAVWGRAGWVNTLLAPFGLDIGSSIFGLQGILAAHVILDGTFAARILLARLEAIPHQKLKIGQSLSLSPWQRFRVLDGPAIASALPGLAAIIFLLAFTSFPIVLLLGGGPANQTLEVAIYSHVRLDFDLGSAVRLALVQLAVCALFVLPAISMTPAVTGAGVTRARTWSDGPVITALQAIILVIAVLGFSLPIIAVLAGAFAPGTLDVVSRPGFTGAVITSFTLSTLSALLALVLTLALTFARAETQNRALRTLLNLPVYAYLLVPAVVLSLGFFLLVRNLGVPVSTAGPFVLILANALLTLPFAVSTLGPALAAVDHRYRRLARSLGLGGFMRWRYVEWPLLGREIGLVFALGFCFSLGDVGVISLFGTEDFSTLPWLMVRVLGAFRSNDAAAIAALILTITFTAFWALPPLFGKFANART